MEFPSSIPSLEREAVFTVFQSILKPEMKHMGGVHIQKKKKKKEQQGGISSMEEG